MARRIRRPLGGGQADSIPSIDTLQKALDAFLEELGIFMEANGMGGFDPIADKGVALAAGVLVGHPRVRPPFIGWTEAEVEKIRAWMKSWDDTFAVPANG